MSKMIAIAFTGGGIIPAAVIGAGEDAHIPPHQQVLVPYAYGWLLIRDRLAYDPDEQAEKQRQADALQAERERQAEAERKEADRIPGLEKTVATLETELAAERGKVIALEERLKASETRKKNTEPAPPLPGVEESKV